MEIFSFIAGSASILSLIISIVMLGKVNKIKKTIQKIEGDENIQAGRDVNI